MSDKVVVRLGGPMRVAFTQEGEAFYARALEFDIVGVGDTRDRARRALHELFIHYVDDFLEDPQSTQFFFPAEAHEWQSEDVEYYDVLIEAEGVNEHIPPRITPSALARMSSSFRGMSLLPA